MIKSATQISRLVSGTLLEKYILGIQLSNLKDGPMYNT